MPPSRHPLLTRATPAPEPSRRSTAKNIIKNTLVILEKAVDGLPIPGLKAAAGSILEIIKIADKVKQNTDGLFELHVHLRRLENAVVTPLLTQQHLGISPALQTRIARLTSELDQLAKDWQKLKAPRNSLLSLINHEDYSAAIADINIRIKDSIDAFLLDSQITGTIVAESTQRMIERMERHLLSKEVLALPRAHAGFDSISRNNAPTCFEGTRVLVLRHITSWLMGYGHRIYILNGIAGIGKTTIAQTIATANKYLSASFFFSRYEDGRNSSRIFFPTLAYQLAQFSEDFEVRISRALMQSPDAPHKTVAEQMKKLILEPLQGIDIPDGRPVLIALDALDECAAMEGAEILQLLINAMPQLPPNFKLLITMRPEPQFFPIIHSSRSHQQLILHDIEAMIVQDDIRRYLCHQLSQGEVQKVIYGCKWQISPQDLEALVRVAGQLFIVASTLEKFIKDIKKRNPARQLEILLGRADLDGRSARSPFAVLDQLYLQVLEAAVPLDDQGDEHIIQRFQNVVGTIITLQHPLSPLSFARLVGEDIVDVQAVLELLQSIIVTNSEDRCPRFYHPSFPDFITDPNRCHNKSFLIDCEKHHSRLAEQCLDIMARLLKRNICHLPVPERYMENRMMPNLKAKIEEHIPAELEYACIYWTTHLEKAARSNKLVEKVEGFVFQHLLSWLEVLSLVGRFDYAYPALVHAQQFSAASTASVPLCRMLDDARRFVIGSYEIMKKSALHIYFSALPFAPAESDLFRVYGGKANESIQVLQGREVIWSPLLAVLGHLWWVNSVVFSPDGTSLATASFDRTVRLWNATTGAAIAVLNGHSEDVTSVIFSPDGTRLASASRDKTVRLWSRVTDVVAELKGHSEGINFIVFSSDGTRLASASEDKTVRLWDGVMGVEVAELKGYSGQLSSVVFSSDGSRLAFASLNHTVRLCNGVTGAVLVELKGHSGWVTSVVFSSDGTRLASASYDTTVRLWNGLTGEVVAELQGHSGVVKPVVFSPDGTRLASASTDKTVRLWNGVTGAKLAELQGHLGPVNSVVFSPDGTRLASTAGDTTVRLWNGVTGGVVAELKGHSNLVLFSQDGTRLASSSHDGVIRIWNGVTGAKIIELKDYPGPGRIDEVVFSPDGTCLAVRRSLSHTVRLLQITRAMPVEVKDQSSCVKCVAFSSDGTRLASAFCDTFVRLWNGVTGEVVAELQGHSSVVNSILFSPNGTLLASASEDKTVRIWNSMTGAKVAELKGHSHAVTSLMFSLDGTRLASASKDKTVRLWNGATGAKVAELKGHPRSVHSTAFSPDGSHFASADKGGTVHLWSAVTGVKVAAMKSRPDPFGSITFSSDGTRLIYESSGGFFVSWDGVDGAFIEEIQGSPSNRVATTFLLDGPEETQWRRVFNPSTMPVHGVNMLRSSPFSGSTIGSFLFEFNEETNCYALSVLLGGVQQTSSKISLCYLPPGLPAGGYATVGSRVAAVFNDGRVFIFSTAQLL